jgi:hypothetical protein
VLNCGSANIPLDAVYPNMGTYQGASTLNGNSTYSMTCTPPGSAGQTLPQVGSYPPLTTTNQGKSSGFWSLTLYQPDSDEVAAPYMSQASMLNTHYSTADLSVLSVNAAADTMTVSAPDWGTLQASTPILFGPNPAAFGLTSNAVYYVANAPTTRTDPATGATTYTFSVASHWIQVLSPDIVPIQDSGQAGPIVALRLPDAGAGPLTYGVVKPVSQLGSDQLSSGHLATNPDGSQTIWIGPTLPAGVPASNWIPTPSTSEFSTLYPGINVSANLQLILRMYYPAPGLPGPSILPYINGSTTLPESNVPPTLMLVSQPNSNSGGGTS